MAERYSKILPWGNGWWACQHEMLLKEDKSNWPLNTVSGIIWAEVIVERVIIKFPKPSFSCVGLLESNSYEWLQAVIVAIILISEYNNLARTQNVSAKRPSVHRGIWYSRHLTSSEVWSAVLSLEVSFWFFDSFAPKKSSCSINENIHSSRSLLGCLNICKNLTLTAAVYGVLFLSYLLVKLHRSLTS